MLNKNNKRELAYVVIIDDITPIYGYDRVELAHVGGWTIVVGKGEFKKGDPAIYFEIDSKLPEVKPFTAMEFLAKKHYKIKTQKMCKSISQGLLMSAKNFGWDIGENPAYGVYIVDGNRERHYVDDESRFLTKQLGVTYAVPEDNSRKSNKPVNKYDKMSKRHGKLFSKMPFRWLMRREWGRKLLFVFFGKKRDSRGFPSWVVKTGEERCQNMPWILKDKEPFIATEKVDGCLDANVSVVTDEGCVPISKIVNSRMDVNVLTYNESLGRCEYKPIKEYHKWERVSDMYDIVVSQQGYKCGNRSKHIVCTSEHSFYTGNGKYIKAKNLMESDTIYHRYMTIDSYSKEILLGILLGDGSLSSKYGIVNGGVDFSHSVNQQDYFYEIVRLLGDGNTTVRNTISGYGSKMLSAHYKTNVEFKSFVEKHCWVNNKKTITKEWADELTPISLAFWYMDDGSITNADSNKARPRIQIATNNFTYDECKILSDMLLNKFNISTEIRTKDVYKGNILYFNTNNTDKFAALIAPYVFDSMKYKLPEYLRCIDYCLSNYTSTNGSSIVPTKILSIEKLQDYKRKYVFDLTIEDNHNYFANGVLTHNTSTTFTLKRGTGLFANDEFYVCSRNVCFDKPDATCFYDKNVYIEMAEKYGIEDRMRELLHDKFPDCEWITIQGETYGGGIQKRDYSIKEHNFMAFNFITSQDGRWNTLEMKDLLEEYGIPCVPVIDESYILPDTVDELLEYAAGKSVIDGGMREGIVFRSLDGKKSFKAVSNEYLMKFHQ